VPVRDRKNLKSLLRVWRGAVIPLDYHAEAFRRFYDPIQLPFQRKRWVLSDSSQSGKQAN
jgi:hypothetical protein